jgi:putative oxidoreductase
MENWKTYLTPLGRLLLSSLFIWAGYHKLMNPGGTAQIFAERYHIPLPDVAVWIAVVIELIGGLMILVGFQTRWVALVLAIFCLGTGFGAHLPVGDVPNMINFYKNLVMAGGFLYVVAYGPGGLSVDHATGMEKG